MEKPSILRYIDFKEFLNDYYLYLKTKAPKLSKRQWSANIHYSLSDGSQVCRVMSGRKKLSNSLLLKFINYFDFSANEKEYFQDLVHFNQSQNPSEKALNFSKLSRHKNSITKTISKGQYLFFKQWYFPPIWSYLSTHPSRTDPIFIAEALDNKISVAIVKNALKIMLELNLIYKTANGYEVTGNHLSTPEELKEITLMEYNQQFLTQAKERLEETAAPNRQYNTMVISCSKEGLKNLKLATQKFQNEIRNIVSQDKNETEVYALGVQLFPYSKSE
jgi:uncharacterized protein (TIGR02147 family)